MDHRLFDRYIIPTVLCAKLVIADLKEAGQFAIWNPISAPWQKLDTVRSGTIGTYGRSRAHRCLEMKHANCS